MTTKQKLNSEQKIKNRYPTTTKSPKRVVEQNLATKVTAKPKNIPKPAFLAPERLKQHGNIKDIDLHKLPENTRNCVEALASISAGPFTFALALLLAVLSSLIANWYVIRPNRKNKSHIISPNLSTTIVAKAGGKKSPIITNAMDPLTQKQVKNLRQFERNYKSDVAEHKIDEYLVDLYEAKAKSLLKQAIEIQDEDPAAYEALIQEATSIQKKLCNKQLEPTPLSTIVTDSTYMGMMHVQSKQAAAIIIKQDEIAQLFERAGGKDSQTSIYRTYLLEGMDGVNDTYTAYRGDKRGKILILRNVISVIGATQPSRLKKFIDELFKGKIAHDGFYNRIGIWADMPAGFKFDSKSVDFEKNQKYFNLYQKINDFCYFKKPLAPTKAPLRKPVYLNEQTEELFKDFKTEIDEVISSCESEFLISQLMKIEKTALSAALVIEIVENFQNLKSREINDISITITENSFLAGVYIAKYYTKSFKSIWGITDSKYTYANVIIDHWNKLGTIFTARDVYQNNWSAIGRNTEKTKTALELLEQKGYIKKLNNSNPSGGRTTTRYKKIK